MGAEGAAASAEATVWAATWVPSRSPIEGYGADGYAVCWVDLVDGHRVQVLAGDGPHEPGTAGVVREASFDGVAVDVFERSDP